MKKLMTMYFYKNLVQLTIYNQINNNINMIKINKGINKYKLKQNNFNTFKTIIIKNTIIILKIIKMTYNKTMIKLKKRN